MKRVLQNSIERTLLAIIKQKDLVLLNGYLNFLKDTLDEKRVESILENIAGILSNKYIDLYNWYMEELSITKDINESIPNIMHLFLDEEYIPGVDFIFNSEGIVVTQDIFDILSEYYAIDFLEEFIEIGKLYV